MLVKGTRVPEHFLFKTPSGSTPLFSSSPGYPLTGGSVYSPPPRLLPRNTFSRSSFKLKKPSKYCSWKCAAMSAIVAAVLLAVLLSYFIVKWTVNVTEHRANQKRASRSYRSGNDKPSPGSARALLLFTSLPSLSLFLFRP
ncbi:teneurin-2 isoform X1, partial [Tachysurus ichikawai]